MADLEWSVEQEQLNVTERKNRHQCQLWWAEWAWSGLRSAFRRMARRELQRRGNLQWSDAVIENSVLCVFFGVGLFLVSKFSTTDARLMMPDGMSWILITQQQCVPISNIDSNEDQQWKFEHASQSNIGSQQMQYMNRTLSIDCYIYQHRCLRLSNHISLFPTK